MRIHLLVVEVVVSLRIGAERGIILVRRQHEWRPAAPTPHQLRGHEFLFLRRFAVLAQKIAKGADMLLQATVGHVAAVACEDLGLR